MKRIIDKEKFEEELEKDIDLRLNVERIIGIFERVEE